MDIQEKIRFKECIHEKVGIALIAKKMTETQSQWFEHLQRRLPKAYVRKVDQMIFNPLKKGKGRPKKTLGEIIQRDFWLNDISKNLISDKNQWHYLIQVANPI